MAQGDNTYFDNDADSVKVNLLYTVAANQLVYVDGFLGITVGAGDSGDQVAVNIDQRGYQLTVPHALAVAKGDYIWIDVTDTTGHTPDSTAYYKATGSNRVRAFKAMTAQDSNDMVIVKMCADT